ncbi:polysaccharide biosynthesis/export family protein [Geomobilimonas luticola]|uniref:Polysaccharide biosynthesis/export family protein n=1 Tax=Geomobilimonas luticola TaxID=1114878 RepID=A0ABS5SD39_9BACT|nr:polysaccharide biosynthesis/export family protein [Geomobilimonas luticola]MBT0653090.1 polysaccharide biosynthesis/export family protein [Geomobilimonas luticola]
MIRLFYVISLTTALVTLNGCATYTDLPAGTSKEIDGNGASPIVTKESVMVRGDGTNDIPTTDYLVGPGDILSVTIYGRSDLAGLGGKGSRVDVNGTIQLPLLGSIQVAGLSLQQIRDRLQDAFKQYLRDPSVVVEVVEYKSHPLYLLGQFKQSGTHYMDRSINLLQGLALGSGLDSTANLRGARLLRDKKIMPVDIYSLLHDGDQSQNVWLQPGDTIYVPDNSLQNVFVFGAVKTPGPIPMKNGQLTLHQAVASAGGLGSISYDKNVRIVRSLTPTRGELIVVDLDKILAGEARPFILMEGDIVYVPKSLVGTWNEAIGEMLPTLHLISGILNPFVQIKYLADRW